MRLLPALVLGVPMLAQTLTPIQERADRFLKLTNAAYKDLTTVQQNAAWAASTDVKPEHDAAAEAAGKAYAAFCGNPVLIQEARELLAQKAQLSDLTVRQLERVLFNAADGPMTNPKLTAERIAAEVHAVNPVFDVTPADLIDAIVTEKGVVERPDAAKMAQLMCRKRLH